MGFHRQPRHLWLTRLCIQTICINWSTGTFGDVDRHASQADVRKFTANLISSKKLPPNQRLGGSGDSYVTFHGKMYTNAFPFND